MNSEGFRNIYFQHVLLKNCICLVEKKKTERTIFNTLAMQRLFFNNEVSDGKS